MSTGQKTVAIIDDDLEVRTATASLLTAYGYGTEIFSSATAFLDSIETSEAICLVVDIQLGDISGVELARQLVAEGFRYPIIFMTALDDEIVRDQAAAVGGIACLNKPFPERLLIEAMIKAIG